MSDRFSGSTIAYQGYGRQLNLGIIQELESIATQGIIPDSTLLLEINVSESISRRMKQKNDRIENEGESFLSRVSSGFEILAKERNWIKIQASLQQAEVSKEIENELKKCLPNIHP